MQIHRSVACTVGESKFFIESLYLNYHSDNTRHRLHTQPPCIRELLGIELDSESPPARTYTGPRQTRYLSSSLSLLCRSRDPSRCTIPDFDFSNIDTLGSIRWINCPDLISLPSSCVLRSLPRADVCPHILSHSPVPYIVGFLVHCSHYVHSSTRGPSVYVLVCLASRH